MNSSEDRDLGQVTRLLRAARQGDRAAHEALLELVYGELRRMAGRQLRRERPGHTLQTTALVHEAWLKLAERPVEWQGRAHFLGIAARAMRQILVDHARRRRADKRGGDRVRTTLGDAAAGMELPAEELLALDDALERLGELDDRLRRVVEYRFFAGMTEQEIGEVLGVNTRTVQRDWVKARAWLYQELYPDRV